MRSVSNTVYNIIHLLNDLAFHTGSELAGQLAITRSAVWKHLAHLADKGVEFERDKKKGYRLKAPLYFLAEEEIRANLKALKECPFYIFTNIASTNSYLKILKAKEAVCLSEEQSEGRGRLNRRWVSPFANNIYCSYLWHFQGDIAELSGLSLVVSLAVVRALKVYGLDKEIGIKWPNDIYYCGKKLAGILVEVAAESHAYAQIVIGLGMNVNMEQADIATPYTSLLQITGTVHNRNRLVACYLDAVTAALCQFKEKGFRVFQKEWEKFDILKAKRLQLKHYQKEYDGIGLGVDTKGHLLVMLEGGKTEAFSSGDTTLHKGNHVENN